MNSIKVHDMLRRIRPLSVSCKDNRKFVIIVVTD